MSNKIKIGIGAIDKTLVRKFDKAVWHRSKDKKETRTSLITKLMKDEVQKWGM